MAATVLPSRDMPLPEKRKRASLSTLTAVFLRQGVPCACCGEPLSPGDFHMDHIHPLDALGGQGEDNWQALCSACHADKTRADLARSRKGARIRGEAGQLKRRRELGPALVSRNDLKGRRSRAIPSRKFSTQRPKRKQA